ncbi:uncharacterized protein LOC144138235 isoform X2 [Haemaphysalis longicornis]
MPQSSVRYNLKWLHKNKSTSVTSAQEMCATYKRKMLSVLKANKALVRALAAARAEMAELKAAASRWGKNEDLYLPILKGWLEADMGHIRALFESHVRASTLLKDLLTADANITLTAASSLLHETACESPPKEPPSLHPPGSRLCNQACSMSMVLEEDDEDRTAVVEPLQDIAQTPEPEISLSSRVTVRKKGSRSGHRCSLPVDEPLPASADQSPVVPSFAVVDTEASILVTEITGQETNVVCAETVVVPPPDELKGHSAHEYSAAFSPRPKIPRTPCSPTKQGARFNAWLEDASSSPAFTRVQRMRASEAAALLPWPGKRGAMAQGPLGRRSSMPAARDCGPGAAKALSPTCVLDEAFIASPSPTQALSRNTLLPREVADFRRDENSPPGAKTRPRKSAFKSRPSEAGRKKVANRVTFFVQKGRTQMAGDAAGDVTNMAIPPAKSGDGQWERGRPATATLGSARRSGRSSDGEPSPPSQAGPLRRRKAATGQEVAGEEVAGAEGGHRPQAARSSPPACRSFFPQHSAQW